MTEKSYITQLLELELNREQAEAAANDTSNNAMQVLGLMKESLSSDIFGTVSHLFPADTV